MNYKELITYLRVNGLLKGKRPAIVYVGKNPGMIYRLKGKNRFILTLNEKGIHFHYLKKWTKAYEPSKDFGIALKDIKYYTVQEMFGTVKNITIYTHDGFYLPFAYFLNGKDFLQGPDNINDILIELKQKHKVIQQNALV